MQVACLTTMYGLYLVSSEGTSNVAISFYIISLAHFDFICTYIECGTFDIDLLINAPFPYNENL